VEDPAAPAPEYHQLLQLFDDDLVLKTKKTFHSASQDFLANWMSAMSFHPRFFR
jgi:hypothetical protein